LAEQAASESSLRTSGFRDTSSEPQGALKHLRAVWEDHDLRVAKNSLDWLEDCLLTAKTGTDNLQIAVRSSTLLLHRDEPSTAHPPETRPPTRIGESSRQGTGLSLNTPIHLKLLKKRRGGDMNVDQ
jgi:hypothetical protein